MVSVDDTAPVIILPMYLFKDDFKTKNPEIYKHIEDVFDNNNRIYKYGIRHLDDDWDVPGAICKLSFMVNRLGVLFTNTDLNIGKYDIPIPYELIENNKYRWTLTNPSAFNIPKLVNEIEKVVKGIPSRYKFKLYISPSKRGDIIAKMNKKCEELHLSKEE